MSLASTDLTTEILLRLPMTSVLRFKTVSKQWLSIASSPGFRQIHASRSSISNATGLIIRKISQSKSRYGLLRLSSQIKSSILPAISNLDIHLSSSSGGLLLFRSSRLQNCSVPNYIVCNPTTNEFKHLTLTFPREFIANSLSVSSYLAFDPRKSPHYKIVFLCQLGNVFSDIVIYSSETKRFSSPKRVIINQYTNRIHGGYYCNDAIHWISEDSCLYYFDLNKEEMKECRPLPIAFECCKYFGESRGHLILVAFNDHFCLVYELKNDYSGWSEKYKVCIAYLSNAFSNDEIRKRIWRDLFEVLGIITDKEDEENLMLVLQVRGDYVAYSFKNKQGLMLEGCLDSTYKNGDGFYSWQYIETFACL